MKIIADAPRRNQVQILKKPCVSTPCGFTTVAVNKIVHPIVNSIIV